MKIYLGSQNPVKIKAATEAAAETWPDIEVEGVDVESGVSEQPFSDEEAQKGAINRAQAALAVADSSLEALGVGLEGGVFEGSDGEIWSTIWAAVVDQAGVVITANGGRFILPAIIAQPLKKGREMGPLMAELFEGRSIRHQEGTIGVITNNFTNRTETYASICKLALGLWYGQDWQKKLP